MPQGWEWCRFRELFDICSSKRVLQSDWKEDGIPFYRAREIVKLSEHGKVNNELFISVEHYNELKTKYGVPQTRDLMVSGVGTIGKVYIVKENDRFYYKDASVLCFQNVNKVISSEFAKYLLESEFMQSQMHSYSKGTTVDTITISTAMDYLCFLPPLSEQHSIVDKLNELLSFVDNIESNKTTLQDLIKQTKSKILDLAIRGKLVPQDPNDEPASVLLERIRAEKEELIKQGKIKHDKKESVIFKGEDNSYYEKIDSDVCCIDEELPFEIPGNWSWCRGTSCFLPMESRKPSGSHFKYIDIDSIDNKHQVIKDAKIIETAKAPSRVSRAVYSGSILFSLVRPYLKNIASVEDDNADSIASTGFYIATSNGIFDSKYLYYLMISDYVVNGLNQFMKGDNSPSISKDNIEKWLYPVAPLKEQIKITSTLQKYIDILEEIEKSLS